MLIPKMADKLVVLAVLLFFSSFRPIISDEVSDQKVVDSGEENDLSPAFAPGSYFQNVVENSVSAKAKSVIPPLHHDDVEEEQTANRNSEDDSEEASSSQTAESKGSLGFFSQVLAELAAPLYGEDEQDFLSEDREPEDPSVEDKTGDDDPEDATYETINGEDDMPKFASSRFVKSVTENVNSARTAEKETYIGGASEIDADEEKGKDQQLPSANKEGNISDSLFGEDEQDFLSEDREPEDPSVKDETGDDDPDDAIYETINGEDDMPKFALSRFVKSVTENVNSARTAEKGTYIGGASKSDADEEKGKDQQLPSANKEGNVLESLYREDEQDFLSEDREPEDPSVEDETGEDDPEDAIYETSNGEDDKPKFAPSRFVRSVTENVNSAQTAEKGTYIGGASKSDADEEKGEDQQLPSANKEGNISESLPHSSTLDSANADNKNPEHPDEQTGEPDVDSSANTNSESSVEQTDDIEIDNQQEKEQFNSNKLQFELDSNVTSVNAEDSKTEPLVKEETAEKEPEIDSVGVNSGSQEPEQEEPKSADSSTGTQSDKKPLHYEDGATELSDEDLEHLRVKSKPSQEQVPSDALEEEEQDLRKNKKEEAERIQEMATELSDEDLEHLRVKSKPSQEQVPSDAVKEEEQDLRKNRKEEEERIKEQARKLRLEKEKRDAEKKKVQEEQKRKKEKKDAERRKKAVEEQARKLALEERKRIAENKKIAIEEHKRKVKLQKEKEAAEEEKKRKEEEARQLRLESLKKQRQQVEETEKKKLSGAERKEEAGNDKVPQDEGIDQGKENPTQEKGETSEDGEDEERMKIKGAFDRKMAEEEAALKKRLEMLSEERRNFEKMAEEYRVSKKERKQKQQKEKMSTKHSAESKPSKATTAVSPSSKQVKTSHAQAATQPTATAPAVNEELTAKETSTKTEATLVKSLQGMPTKVKEPIGSRTKQTTATVTATTRTTVKEQGLNSVDVKPSEATDLGMETEPVDESKEDKIPSDKATCIEGFCQATPNVISLASRFQKVEDSLTSKVVLGETQFNNLMRLMTKTNDSQVNETLSAYATFMRAFRNIHEKSVLFLISHWPAVKNKTRSLLTHVGLDGMFEQLCNDLADVHPAVLFVTFLLGTLGFLYFFWSLTFGRLRHGAQGPSPRDVLKSYEARILILEQEVEALEDDKDKLEIEQVAALKQKVIYEEQLRNTNKLVRELTDREEKYKRDKQNVEELVKEMKDNFEKLKTESYEKSEQIAGCKNMILDLSAKIEAKEGEIQKLNDDFQKEQMEKGSDKKHIDELDEKIQQAGVENEKLEHLLTEAKEKKQNLQVEFDDQLLRLTELQQQYEFKCNEVEVLKDCLKQIKLHGDGEEEPDEDEMTGRLQNLMNVDEIKAENKKFQEKVAELETEAEELRRIRKMLENDNVEKTERLDQAERKASQAMLTQREKEIELEALQKYFKSTEVELHRKITAEESSRISIENQLQSEQAKASTAVVDADKYRQLYLDIKKQIEEIDESKKEQLSNMEKKSHQNWLDYRAAVRELDGLKDENEILRRKLYDLEVRGSRPSSSASSQLNHVDGRDSPSRRSPMSGLPGHGSPVPFTAPPMMGPQPPPPPPSVMFPGQRRPHPADMLGMTPPRPPFPSPGPASRGHATPPPTTSAATAQSPKTGDRPDSFVQDSKDGVPPPPPMSGYGHPPLPPMMRMPMFPPRPMMPPPSGPLPRMFLPRPGGPMPPPPPQGPRPQASSTPNRS